MDYALPTASDIPAMQIIHQHSPSPLNPLGVKGVGEGGAVAPPAAIANAVCDALAPFGVEFNATPIDAGAARSSNAAALTVRRDVTQPLSPLALEVRALEKRFDHPAVDGLDLSVPAGEFFTLLGPNGAGKTTTLRLVTGLLKPDRGSIAVYGIDALADPIAARRIMAWVSDEPMIYEKLTPMEYLDFVARAMGGRVQSRRGAGTRLARLARFGATCRRALRAVVQRHAPEGGIGRRACARAEAHHAG